MSSAQIKLREAARAGSLFNVRKACREGANVNSCGSNESPVIILAVLGGHTEVVAALVASKAMLEAQDVAGGRSALHLAAERNDVAVAESLLAGKALADSVDASQCGETPLIKAARMGHNEVAAVLVAHRAWLSARTSDQTQECALIKAARGGHAEV